MYLIYVLNYSVAALCLFLAYKILFSPEIGRKYVIKNQIQAITEAEKFMNSSDRIVLMKKQLDTLNLDEIPLWQRRAFVEAVLEKFRAKC